MRTIIYILFLFLPLAGIAQDYFEYQRIFNRVDADVLGNDMKTATHRLDSVYDNYKFIYANHCIKALQICCAQNDSIAAAKWLQKSFLQGVPFYVIGLHKLTEKVLHYTNALPVITAYDSLHAVYETSYNHALAKTIDSLLVIDQRHTRRINFGFILLKPIHYPLWLHNNNKEFKILCNIIKQYGFPDERLTGLRTFDSVWAVKSFTSLGINFIHGKVLTMFMHYYSRPHKDINELLLKNVATGYMPAYQYARINDFLAEYGKSKNGNYPYYGEWFHTKIAADSTAVNNRRSQLGLASLQEQERNNTLHHSRLKNKTANQEIKLE